MLTGSDELAAQAGELTARCDVILYGDLPGEPASDCANCSTTPEGFLRPSGGSRAQMRRGG